MKAVSTYDGDVVVNKTIEIATDPEALRQKVERVLGTNQGEWSFDPLEGIDFSVILCKNPDEDEIRIEIEEALMRLDETFAITDFNLTIENRHATITFTAINSGGAEVGGAYTYAG